MEQVVGAGFHGMQAEPERGKQILDSGLRFAAGGRANTLSEIDLLVSRSKDAGAHCLTVHLGWGDEDDAAADRLVHGTLEAAERHLLPVFIETHRATVVQDLWRTNRLIERIPQVRFNGDYSHYYLAHEAPYRGLVAFRRQIGPVLERTAFFHGRVSNGQCIQISIADAAHAEHLENFRELWRSAMQYWRQQAQKGDVLPFVPELGPPASGYAITSAGAGGVRLELANRWQETLQLKAIAEELWASLSPEPAAAPEARPAQLPPVR